MAINYVSRFFVKRIFLKDVRIYSTIIYNIYRRTGRTSTKINKNNHNGRFGEDLLAFKGENMPGRSVEIKGDLIYYKKENLRQCRGITVQLWILVHNKSVNT